MTEDELLAFVRAESERAIGSHSGVLSDERELAIRFYHGEVDLDDPPEGRSNMVSTDVRDAIDGMLPDLLDVFLSTKNIVEFEPQGPEDEEQAREATQFCNYVFFRQNQGAMLLHSWFKTAGLEKNAYIKAVWDDYAETSEESYDALSDLELQAIVLQDNVEVLSHEPYIDGATQQPMHKVSIRRTEKDPRVCLYAVPPDEIRVNPEHNEVSLQRAHFVEHTCRKSRGELRAMGYSDEDIDAMDSDDDIAFGPEHQARSRYNETEDLGDSGFDFRWLKEAYVLVDGERRMIVYGRDRILRNDPIEQVPIYAISPNPLPFRHHGLSIADNVVDVQRSKTFIIRQMHDSLHLANNPRIGVFESMVNLDDLLVSRPGGVVRFKGPPAQSWQPIETQFVGAQSFPMLEYLDGLKENRTGFTRYNQGSDAGSLNKTATGVSIIASSAAKRLRLIARFYAEGLRELFRGILWMYRKYASGPIAFRLMNKPVTVDPRQWKYLWDMTVNVGLGTQDKTAEQAQLMAIGQLLKTFRESGMSHMVTDMNLYNYGKKVVETAGYHNEGEFLTNPEGQQPPEPPPPPEIVKAQMDAQTKQAEMEQADRHKQWELEAQKALEQMRGEIQILLAHIKEGASTEREQMKAQHAGDLERLKADSAAELEVFRTNAKAGEGEKEKGSSVQVVNGKELNFEPLVEPIKALAEQNIALAQQIQQLFAAVNAPKQVMRDEMGNIVGVQPMLQGEK